MGLLTRTCLEEGFRAVGVSTERDEGRRVRIGIGGRVGGCLVLDQLQEGVGIDGRDDELYCILQSAL